MVTFVEIKVIIIKLKAISIFGRINIANTDAENEATAITRKVKLTRYEKIFFIVYFINASTLF